jgi:hypothetical protein
LRKGLAATEIPKGDVSHGRASAFLDTASEIRELNDQGVADRMPDVRRRRNGSRSAVRILKTVRLIDATFFDIEVPRLMGRVIAAAGSDRAEELPGADRMVRW